MSGPFLLEMTLKASLVLVVAWAVTRAMSARSSASTRHLVWLAAVAGLVLLPVLMLFGPAWRVAVVPGMWAARASAVFRLSSQGSSPFASADVWPATTRVASHAPVDPSRPPPKPRAQRLTSAQSFTWTGALTWPVLIVGVWAAGAVLAALRLIAGLSWALWIARRSTPVVAADWLAVKHEAAQTLGVTRDVALRMSTRVGVPVACGILRPTLLLSPEADAWDPARRKIVLLHELAHVTRHDCQTQLLAQVAQVVHWFNPLAWMAVARLRAEQEQACDDQVLKAGTPASDYADHLCEIVRASQVVSAPGWATLAVKRRSRLHDRVRAILDDTLTRRLPSRVFCVSFGILACVGVLSLGALRPSAIEAMALLPSVALDRIAPDGPVMALPPPRLLVDTSSNAVDTPSRGPAVTAVAARAGMNDQAAGALLNTYCAACHNDALKTAGVSVAGFDVSTLGNHPELGEKVVRKVRSGLHPSRGVSRPAPATAVAFSAAVEAAIDHRDSANRRPAIADSIDDRELAIRLARFLWNSEPDGDLLTAAARGNLRDSSAVERQVRRMLSDDRSSAMLTRFFSQWLRLDSLDRLNLASPDIDAGLRDALRREIDLFLASQVRDNHSVVDLLTANYSFVNDRLAQHYGIAGVTGSQFRRVVLSDEARYGLVGKAGILALTSFGNRTSPVVRGKYVMETFLGLAAPAPPPNIPALRELKPDEPPLSMRQRMDQHTRNPICASCHSAIDPFGFALENFDTLGRWRDVDGTPIDASGLLPDGTAFTGPAGVRAALVDRQEMFVSTLTLRLLAYALGRPAKYADMPAVRAVLSDTAPNHYQWTSLIAALVHSPPFQAKPVAP
ncbi:MAG TPA: M56 family metallopeptidase [Vicinamibacterales bacterium]|jgi:beta-lactamase regulating signal transducer with metallopeptidase domain/mono/diheme cytochrome c family protein|nr:M56 family metallopeptidase [Vicinamibacterales bacterium]